MERARVYLDSLLGKSYYYAPFSRAVLSPKNHAQVGEYADYFCKSCRTPLPSKRYKVSH